MNYASYMGRENRYQKVDYHIEQLLNDGLKCEYCEQRGGDIETNHLLLTVEWECGECGFRNVRGIGGNDGD
jgi:hypothetical protein